MVELKSFDRVADVYDETRGMPPAAESGHCGQAIWAELADGVARPRVVEVGIGTGRIAVPLAERGAAVVGTDIAPKMLARLRQKRGRHRRVPGGGRTTAVSRLGVFDAALFVHVLHLVPDVAATVRATLALVRPRGVMIFGRDDEQTGVREAADRAIREIVREVCGIEMSGMEAIRRERRHRRAGARRRGCTIADGARRGVGLAHDGEAAR